MVIKYIFRGVEMNHIQIGDFVEGKDIAEKEISGQVTGILKSINVARIKTGDTSRYNYTYADIDDLKIK